MRRAVRRPLPRDDRAEQLVGVQAALHQSSGPALAHERHARARGVVAVRRRRRSRSREVRSSCASRPRRSSRTGRPGSARSVRARRPRSPRERGLSHGCATAVGIGSSCSHRSRMLFVLARSGRSLHDFAGAPIGTGDAAPGPVSGRERRVRRIASRSPTRVAGRQAGSARAELRGSARRAAQPHAKPARAAR
jgi:hypothetical protein